MVVVWGRKLCWPWPCPGPGWHWPCNIHCTRHHQDTTLWVINITGVVSSHILYITNCVNTRIVSDNPGILCGVLCVSWAVLHDQASASVTWSRSMSWVTQTGQWWKYQLGRDLEPIIGKYLLDAWYTHVWYQAVQLSWGWYGKITGQKKKQLNCKVVMQEGFIIKTW